MTTSIITNMLEPMCELFYKFVKSTDVHQATINTVRNYGFSTSYAVNFGFEVYKPFDLNDFYLQPGVFTYNAVYNVLPNLSTNTKLGVTNAISLQDLPQVGIGTVTYQNKTLPINISISSSGSTVLGIASAYKTNGIPYDNSYNLNQSIIRSFESSLVNNSDLQILLLVDFEDVTINGINTNWSVLPSAIYRSNIASYRYNNGYGQFYSFNANNNFVAPNISTSNSVYEVLFDSTYMNVYNWANLLDWDPDFVSWYALNKSLIPEFVQKFLLEYFDVS